MSEVQGARGVFWQQGAGMGFRPWVSATGRQSRQRLLELAACLSRWSGPQYDPSKATCSG